METVNTLQHFLDLKSGGIPDEQAKTQAFALNKALYGFATKDDLAQGLAGLEKDLKIFFGYAIGGSLLTAFIFPTTVGLVIVGILKLAGKF
jgi:hypothetical protein